MIDHKNPAETDVGKIIASRGCKCVRIEVGATHEPLNMRVHILAPNGKRKVSEFSWRASSALIRDWLKDDCAALLGLGVTA